MGTKLLLGKPVSEYIIAKLSKKIEELKKNGITPGLAAILVGDNPASQVYVRNKSRFFKENNCYSETFILDKDIDEKSLVELISTINTDKKFHGILVQLPLPKHLTSKKILNHVDPKKDVDGFHPFNLGSLLEGNPTFIPCTPNGIIEILKFYNIDTNGKHVVIVGRSNIVGKPMFALLSQKFKTGNATVTVCHTGTDNISKFTKQADILIAAVGVPELITADMIKDNCIIIDVGINRVDDSSTKKGYKLVGDVDFKSVMSKVNAITPVPGGVGPMTISMLLHNTVMSASNQINNY